MASYTANTLDDLKTAAEWLINENSDAKVFLFQGNMGAGKTTFIKEICSFLGVKDSTSSPTFSLVNEYDSSNGTIYHFDFYRLKDEQEAFDFGYEEYFYSGNYCFVEWPEKIPNLLPDNAIVVSLTVEQDQSRTIGTKNI